MSTRIRVVLAALVAVVVLAGIGLYWFFRDDAPDQVSLSSATATVVTAAGGPAGGAVAGGDLSGTWVVDTETGEFNYERATGTFAGFRIKEELASIGSTTAVGRTGEVAGSMTVDGNAVTAASFQVDVSSITTNESRRDNQVQKALQTDQFPTATFTLTQPIPLDPSATGGTAVSVPAAGTLTIHGVTRDVTFPLEAQLVGDTIVVVGSTDLTFSDYGVQVPTSPVVLSVEDHGVLELQLLLKRG